jgi:hypothetical protein
MLTKWEIPRVVLGLILEGLLEQGCHNGRFWRKITVRTCVDVVRTSARVRVYLADAVLPADGFLLSDDAVKTASARTRKYKK